MTQAVLVLTTVAAGFDSRGLAQSLVESRLAACVNILAGVTSVYRWEGKVSDDDEQLLLIKSSSERVDALREALFSMHPYAVPEFVVIPIGATSEAYGTWLLASVAADGKEEPDPE